MSVAALINSLEIETRYLPIAEGSIGVEALANPSEKEVLAFLSERPIHTVRWLAPFAITAWLVH